MNYARVAFHVLLATAPFGAIAAGCVDSDETPPAADLDAGFEASTTDAPAAVDAGKDSAPLIDSPAPVDVITPVEAGDAADADTGVLLVASSTNVTTAGSVTLTASSSVGTITSVDFMEGATVLATVSSAPFELVIPYSYFENGTHNYVAKATIAVAPVSSAPTTVTVNVPANGFFVDPTGGSDTNTGTEASAYKTIKKAVDSLTTGQTIYLKAGTYDNTNQTVFSFTFNFPVFVRGFGGPVTIKNGAGGLFIFSQGGGVRDVKIEDYVSPIDVENGTFVASNISFNNVNGPMFFKGNSVVTIDNSAVAQPFTNPQGAFCATFDAEGGSNVTYKGGTLSGVAIPLNGIFVRGHSTVSVQDFTINGLPGHAVVLYDTAHLTMTNVTINASGLGTSSGIDKAVIAMGGQNTEAPTTTALTLDNCSITASTGPVVGLSEYPNVASTQSITLNNSHLDGSTGTFGYGILVQNTGTPVGQTLTINSTNTTFKNLQSAALSVPRPTVLNITGGEISGNGGAGIEITDAASINSLKVRGTTFDGNTGDAISFAGAVTSSLDLGKTGAGLAGGLTFTNVAASKSAVHLSAVIGGFAVGNTWIPSIQGADNTGHYATSPKVLTTADGSNKNVTIVGAGSLTVD